jgi:hypothetical protein
MNTEQSKKHQHVVVAGIEAEDGSVILITASKNPLETSVAKSHKQLGFVKDDQLITTEGAETVSQNDTDFILKTAKVLHTALDSLAAL